MQISHLKEFFEKLERKLEEEVRNIESRAEDNAKNLNEVLNREGNSLAAEQNSIASLGLKLKRDFKRFAK